jgi:hypothetical protein
MNNTKRTGSGKITRSRTGLVSLLIIAAVTSGLGMVMATIPNVAYADKSATLNCLNTGGAGGTGGKGGVGVGGDGGVNAGGKGGNDNGNGGDKNKGGGNGGNKDGNGGDAEGANGGDAKANGGQGGSGGKARQICILVKEVVDVNLPIKVPSFEHDPDKDLLIAEMTERVAAR